MQLLFNSLYVHPQLVYQEEMNQSVNLLDMQMFAMHCWHLEDVQVSSSASCKRSMVAHNALLCIGSQKVLCVSSQKYNSSLNTAALSAPNHNTLLYTPSALYISTHTQTHTCTHHCQMCHTNYWL